MSDKKVYIGGWKQFREDCGATRKEAMEDFSWMGVQTIGTCMNLWSSEPRPATFGDDSNRTYYEDCRDALARIEGAKEWLKNYVKPEKGDSFDDAIGNQIRLHSGHSGCSYYSILWSYKYLLNNWEDWVLKQKERDAMTHYRHMRVDPYKIAHLVGDIDQILKGVPPSSVYNSQEHILRRAGAIGLEGKSIQEIHDICLQIMEENEEIRAKEEAEQNERQHQDLIGGLVFKYQNPSRWFDTVRGSTLFPVDPSYITQRAYVEMEAKYPGYRSHIQDISRTLSANQRSMPK
jgi:hypothetical protein